MVMLKERLESYYGMASDMEKEVIDEVLEYTSGEADNFGNHDDAIKSWFEDLFRGGCASGFVGSMIYHTDTVAFYERNKQEIDKLLSDTLQMSGVSSPAEIFTGDISWDIEDPLALETSNQNLLAWFAFEETAYSLANMFNIEI